MGAPQSHILAGGERRHRLCKSLEAEGLDGLLVSGEKDIYYLTGFVGHDSLLLVLTDGSAAIISDPRYDEFLEPWRGAEGSGGGCDVVMGERHRLEDSLPGLLRGGAVKRLGIQAERLTVAGRRKVEAALGADALAETVGLVSRLRMKKDIGEIGLIERAIAIQEQSLEAALAHLQPGMTELQFCAHLEFEMKMRGASGPSFDTMIASGPNSSVIHYQTGHAPIEAGVLLIDWGAIVDGYRSDMTRTFGLGTMPPKVEEVYRIVADAQEAAIDAIAPGKSCAEIDEVARSVIRKAGYGERFGHGLGHGLGMDTHEPPFFNSLQTDITLEPGMVMTVEPGIYLPGVGGVRIEDDVLVVDGGSRVLSGYPKRLSDAMISFGAAAEDLPKSLAGQAGLRR